MDADLGCSMFRLLGVRSGSHCVSRVVPEPDACSVLRGGEGINLGTFTNTEKAVTKKNTKFHIWKCCYAFTSYTVITHVAKDAPKQVYWHKAIFIKKDF